MIILLAFAFLGGVVTILSPCILPILPIVLSGSVAGGKQRPWGIVTGFILGFTFFTLFLTTIVNSFNVSPDALRSISVFIIAIFGASLLIPKLQLLTEMAFSRLANKAPKFKGEGYGSGILIGLSLGLVWTPCVGPILASVISLALTGQVTGSAFLITLAYSVGTALPMLGIMLGGQKVISRLPILMKNAALIQKIFGVIMILTALAIFFNVDRKIQTYILEAFPGYGSGLTALEDNQAVKDALNINMEDPELKKSGAPAPELIAGGQWFNSAPLTLAELKGEKVVLLDIMTYSCINCIRTFPYLKDWWTKYKNDGLVIIGIHTPEFEFEKNPDNVAKALKDFGLEFPVMQDNNYATWRAYKNNYWPRKYLIDIHGNLIYDHIGEGNYEETEEKIIQALKERKQFLQEADEISVGVMPEISDAALVPSSNASPEVYFGAQRNELLANGTAGLAGQQNFKELRAVLLNQLYLVGDWNITPESAQSASTGSKVIFRYSAKNVFMVAGSGSAAEITVKLDGQTVSDLAGKDVENSQVIINDQKLYHLIGGAEKEIHTLELIIEEGTFEIFTFTFG